MKIFVILSPSQNLGLAGGEKWENLLQRKSL